MAGIDITETMQAFRARSEELWEELARDGVEPDEDFFHEAMNRLFQSEVSTLLGLDAGHYAFYTAEGESQSPIRITTGSMNAVLVGKRDGNARNWQWARLDGGVRLEFRELSHPFDWRDRASLNWVYCEDVSSRDHVCIPIEHATFTVGGC